MQIPSWKLFRETIVDAKNRKNKLHEKTWYSRRGRSVTENVRAFISAIFNALSFIENASTRSVSSDTRS